MKYLSARHILFLHSLALEKDGGAHGVRDYHAILSLENLVKQKVFGKELYPTLFDKAALYARNIIMNHPFLDGNKRTGMLCAFTFLERNKYNIIAQKGEIEQFALLVITKRLTIQQIAHWLKKHSRKI